MKMYHLIKSPMYKNHSEDLVNLNPTSIAQFVCARIYDGVPTSELDELTSKYVQVILQNIQNMGY